MATVLDDSEDSGAECAYSLRRYGDRTSGVFLLYRRTDYCFHFSPHLSCVMLGSSFPSSRKIPTLPTCLPTYVVSKALFVPYNYFCATGLQCGMMVGEEIPKDLEAYKEIASRKIYELKWKREK